VFDFANNLIGSSGWWRDGSENYRLDGSAVCVLAQTIDASRAFWTIGVLVEDRIL
jgi:hypothetical protein